MSAGPDVAGPAAQVPEAAPSGFAAEAGEALLRPVRPGNAFEDTVGRLLETIRLGVLAPGESLPPERELAARLGVIRVPGPPIAASDTSVRIVIQDVLDPLFGRMKLPVYVAPGASSSSSPGCAASIADCRLAPAATRTWRAGLGYAVGTLDRGSSARIDTALSVPLPPGAVGPVVPVGAFSITVIPRLPETPSALA